MIITIKVSSTNSNSLISFSKFLTNKLNKIKNIKVIFFNIVKTKKIKNKYTVLKSPHVNKNAQEQFEIIHYSRIIQIYSYKNMFLLCIIKRLIYNLVSNIKLKINLTSNSNNIYKNLKADFNSNNIYLTRFNFNKKQYKNYLKRFDLFGEIIFKY